MRLPTLYSIAGGLMAAAFASAALPSAAQTNPGFNARTRNFNNLTPITIADSCPEPEAEECIGLPDYHYNDGIEFIPVPIIPASVYPSPITVPAAAFVAGAKITDVNVSIKNISHGTIDDVDIVLVGPQGQYVFLASNVSSGTFQATNLNWKFDDSAKLPLPNSSSNSGRASTRTTSPLYNLVYPEWVNVWTTTEERKFKPTDYDADSDDQDVLPGVPSVTNKPQVSITYPPAPYNTADPSQNPAPTVTGGTPLSVFNGTSPTGTWNLYIVDDWYWYDGSVDGWALEITAAP